MPAVKNAIGVKRRKVGPRGQFVANNEGELALHGETMRRKREQHERVQAAISEFLARGGTITRVP